MIYIASPYSHEDYEVRNRRFIGVREYAWSLMSQGHQCFSPIVYGHYYDRQFEPRLSHGYWMNFCEHFLPSCVEMHVLMLSGWDTSLGISLELKLAGTYAIPVIYAEPLPHANF